VPGVALLFGGGATVESLQGRPNGWFPRRLNHVRGLLGGHRRLTTGLPVGGNGMARGEGPEAFRCASAGRRGFRVIETGIVAVFGSRWGANPPGNSVPAGTGDQPASQGSSSRSGSGELGGGPGLGPGGRGLQSRSFRHEAGRCHGPRACAAGQKGRVSPRHPGVGDKATKHWLVQNFVVMGPGPAEVRTEGGDASADQRGAVA